MHETDRLLIEDISPAHAGEMFNGLQDSRAYKFIPDDPPRHFTALRERYRKLSANKISPDGREEWLNWVLRLKEGGSLIGFIQATINVGDRESLVAYQLFPAFWGKGYAQESLEWLVQELFHNRGVNVLVALIDTRNTNSIRLVEKIGFTIEKIIKDADYFKWRTSDEFRFILRREKFSL